MAGMHIVTQPAVEPITLAEAKQHLRVDVTDDDALITILIIGAREACEAFIHGKLITQTWEVELDAWPTDQLPVLIPIEPLISVQSVKWADDLNTVTTMTVATDYLVDTDSEPGRLVLPPAPLPTEQASGVHIEPRGQVVDVGRMAVVPDYRSYRSAAFIALLCRLYLEMRNGGFQVACGMMSARVRTLTRQLGLQLETLGPDVHYWGELRTPVRFALLANAQSLDGRWRGTE